MDELVAWSPYAGAVRAVVLALKHHGRRDVVRWLGAELAAVAPLGADRVTWVPASVSGRRQRGFDQGALLARALAGHLDLPAAPLLRRPRAAASQRGRSRAERLGGAPLRARRPVGGRVLVVDDVVATGASLSRAAATLRAAGAVGVSAVVVAVADRELGPCPPLVARS